MKIEKINDNQIKCILSNEDLIQRHIEISELAYGTEKATNLFREMTELANRQFGFQVGDTPVMVEAVPMENNSITLLITKVEDPEELDTRFSRFSPFKDNDSDSNISQMEEKIHKANEILNLLNSFREALSESKNNQSTKAKEHKSSSNNISKNNNLFFIYSFDNFDKLIALSKVLKSKYHGRNSIYRKDGEFLLMIEKSDTTPEEFNQICNIICEFGDRSPQTFYTNMYLNEHCELILKDNALEELLNL